MLDAIDRGDRRRAPRRARRSPAAGRLPRRARARARRLRDRATSPAPSPTSSSAAIRTSSPTSQVDGADDVLRNWQQIKAAERPTPRRAASSTTCRAPCRARPRPEGRRSAGRRRLRLGRRERRPRRARRGARELDQALAAGDREAAGRELGDLLLTLSSLARHLGVVGGARAAARRPIAWPRASATSKRRPRRRAPRSASSMRPRATVCGTTRSAPREFDPLSGGVTHARPWHSTPRQ